MINFSTAALPRARRIDQVRLVKLLSAGARRFALEVATETGSTNADLKQRLSAADCPALPLVRIAYRQTAGRGRCGRPWLAAAGDGLLFSLAYEMPRPPDGLAGLSLATGCAIIAGLRALPLLEPHRLALKWPNDLLLDGAKLAGVLIETARCTDVASVVIIGVGINLYGESTLAAQLDTRAAPPAALARVLPEIAVTEVLAHLLNALAAMLKRFAADGFAPFVEAWCADHAYAGCEAALFEQGREIATGVATGVDALGRLRIDTGAGIRTITTGDISLRLRKPLH